MTGWQNDKAWSDRYVPIIKPILGTHLIGAAPVEEDQERNTDLIVLKLDPVRVACRVRRPETDPRYRGEFTIRTSRPSGAKTELHKLIEGFGDFLFYAVADFSTEPAFMVWTLGRLSVFRGWISHELARGRKPGSEQRNRDGSSTFRAFRFGDIPGFVVAASSAETHQHHSAMVRALEVHP